VRRDDFGGLLKDVDTGGSIPLGNGFAFCSMAKCRKETTMTGRLNLLLCEAVSVPLPCAGSSAPRAPPLQLCSINSKCKDRTFDVGSQDRLNMAGKSKKLPTTR
jgi:hypothetical protein